MTRFEVGGTFDVNASVDEDDICCELGNIFIEVYDLDETPIERLCVDFVVTVSPSPDLVDHVSPDPLDIFYAFLSCSLLLSVVICHLLILMLYLRRMTLTILSLEVLLESMSCPLILIVCT